MDWDFELDKVAEEIKTAGAKKVVLQLPDGLKPKAMELARRLEKLTGAQFYIWFGSNFGACDVPLHIEKNNFDMIVNFGHSAP